MATAAELNRQYAELNKQYNHANSVNHALDRLLQAAERDAKRRKRDQEARERDEMFGFMMDLAKDVDVAGIYKATCYLPPLLRAIK